MSRTPPRPTYPVANFAPHPPAELAFASAGLVAEELTKILVTKAPQLGEMLYLFTPLHPCRARDPGEKWWKSTVWTIPVEKGARVGHPATMPLELARRCLVASNAPRLVLDPFCGSGTTLLAAARLGFDAVGFDLEARYLALAQERLVTDNPLFAPTITTSRDTGRQCAASGCAATVQGRADRLTCSDVCRQRLARARRSDPHHVNTCAQAVFPLEARDAESAEVAE